MPNGETYIGTFDYRGYMSSGTFVDPETNKSYTYNNGNLIGISLPQEAPPSMPPEPETSELIEESEIQIKVGSNFYPGILTGAAFLGTQGKVSSIDPLTLRAAVAKSSNDRKTKGEKKLKKQKRKVEKQLKKKKKLKPGKRKRLERKLITLNAKLKAKGIVDKSSGTSSGASFGTIEVSEEGQKQMAADTAAAAVAAAQSGDGDGDSSGSSMGGS